MSKRKRIQFRITHTTPSGKYVEIKEKQDGTDRMEYKYMGLQVSHEQTFLPKTQFIQRGIATDSTGRIKCFVGDTQDVINDDLTTEIRSTISISGRDKQVANKKATGELRRKRCDAKALSFGVSKSKAYHKAKHSK
jgi:hypothetical protein